MKPPNAVDQAAPAEGGRWTMTGTSPLTRRAIQLRRGSRSPRPRPPATAVLYRLGQLAFDVATVGLAVGFGKSDNLGSAYGIAVSAPMPMTSMLLFIAMR
jgi:K+ transporter